jgi:hypothetical protein
MTGKPKIEKDPLLKELKTLFGQVEKLQKRTARSEVAVSLWSATLGIQNAVQDAIDIVEGWED